MSSQSICTRLGHPKDALSTELQRRGSTFILTSLHAELQVGQPLGVLLALNVDVGLLAGVQLGVADPAVVRQVRTGSGIEECFMSPKALL